MAKAPKVAVIKRIRVIPVLLLVTTVALAIGFMLRLFAQPKAPPAPNSDLYPIIDTIGMAISSKYSEYSSRKQNWQAETADGTAVHISGYDFSITTDSYPNLLIYAPATHFVDVQSQFVVPAHNLTAVGAVIAATFTSRGFHNQADQTEQVSAVAPKTTYIKHDETCTTTSDLIYYQVHIVCSSPSLQQQLAAQAKPYVMSYVQSNPGVKASDIAFGPLVIKSKDTI